MGRSPDPCIAKPGLDPSERFTILIWETKSVCQKPWQGITTTSMWLKICGRSVPIRPHALLFIRCRIYWCILPLKQNCYSGLKCKVPHVQFDVASNAPSTSNHTRIQYAGDQPASAGPRVNKHPSATQSRPLTAPQFPMRWSRHGSERTNQSSRPVSHTLAQRYGVVSVRTNSKWFDET